jgi:hypothetical protein
LIAILKRWWDLGLYPMGRTSYLDIPNLFVKSQLTREIKVVNDNNNNIDNTMKKECLKEINMKKECLKEQIEDKLNLEYDEESECIICYGNFPKQLIELKPCNHRNYCKDCALKISKCSLCNTTITERVQNNNNN